MLLGAILLSALSLLQLAGAQTPTPTTTNSSQPFITVQNGVFMRNNQLRIRCSRIARRLLTWGAANKGRFDMLERPLIGFNW